MIPIEEGLTLGMSALLSLHGGTLTLIDWFATKILVLRKRIGRMFSTNFCDTQITCF